ncbi:hypothetical protein HU675_0035475 [Bradyrhizobium septentrionale]|uniref:hypothetical protein n=1 Tax=Bradyrhizobium septentrionale TaxID=1404411 RepID=UPI0015965BD2|nr:hypothetical protein [Bradyrhizobium septentrionale]UGY23220.1 hypothetical protein HU675_0035475 [Bradyrhizobium septentrionale]
MGLFLRPTVIAGDKLENDFAVIHQGRTVGRIRLATERSPVFWTYAITVPLPVPPDSSGGAADLEDAKSRFRDAWERLYCGLDRKSIELWHHTQEFCASTAASLVRSSPSSASTSKA